MFINFTILFHVLILKVYNEALTFISNLHQYIIRNGMIQYMISWGYNSVIEHLISKQAAWI